MKELKFTDFDRDKYLKGIKKLRKYHSVVPFITPEFENYIRSSFMELIGFIPCLKSSTCFSHAFERIVVNRRVSAGNSRLKSYSQIKYPPDSVLDKITYNRANLPGQSIFYAAYGGLVAALESKPELGDLFTYSLWKQKQDTWITYLPIYHKQEIIDSTSEFYEDWKRYQKTLSSLNKNVAIIVEEIYDFIATVFTAKVNPDNKIEYLFSAIFSDVFMNSSPHNVDCIYYPSVAGDLVASNIAVKPKVLEELFDIEEINESFCVRSGDGYRKQWFSYRTGKAIEINKGDEFIKWQTEDISETWVIDLMKQFKVNLDN